MRSLVALLFVGSAIMFWSCGEKPLPQNDDEVNEGLLTTQADSLTIIISEHGKKSYRFFTPLLERYEQAREPYTEYRRGVFIEFFKSDSTQTVESTLVADYAIQFEKQDLWEAKGNVVAVNAEGQKLETQQLFWNRVTKKVYSNVDTKITTPEGDVIIGTGFESDEEFVVWELRKPKGQIAVEVDDVLGGEQSAQPDGEGGAPQPKRASEATAAGEAGQTAPEAADTPSASPAGQTK